MDEYVRKDVYNIIVPKVEEPRVPPVDKVLEEYKQTKKLFEETSLVNFSKFDVVEAKVNIIVEKIKRKKELKEQWKKMDELAAKIEDPDVFKPKMAGKTKMPAFFFSNLVKQNRSSFQESLERNKMTSRFCRNH